MRSLLPLAALGAALGCGRPDAPPASSPPARSVSTADSTVLPGEVRTETFEPEPIRVRLERLPAPYATNSASRSPRVVPVPPGAVLRVPPGFRVNVWADGLDRPRWLALTPEGDVLLAESRANRIRLLRDADGDGASDQNVTFADRADGLDRPFGMAFAGGFFFVGNTDEVVRWPWRAGQNALEGGGERIAELPGGGYNQHWTRNVISSARGDSLFVSVGSRSNADEEELPRASVFRIALDGSGLSTVGFGLRNPVGLATHPATGALYATVNERDGLGDDLVPDYFTRVSGGAFYGWPYAYLAPQNLDPRHASGGRSVRPALAARTRTPDVLFQAHSAALGLAFYDAPAEAPSAFPARYRGGAFAVFRGSWNRRSGTGYKVVFIPFDGGQPAGHYEDFVTGFLTDPAGPTAWGRPVGALVLPDGSFLFTEEANGRIYRVSYGA